MNRTRATSTNSIRADYRYAGLFQHAPSGLYLTHYRVYDPGTARWISRDPMGEEGGINLYTYVENQPTSLTDPEGLTTYMCTQPLHALGEKWGPRLYPESQLNPSPFYHQYVCVPDGRGGMSCGGQDRADGPWGLGKPSSDSFKTESCKPVDEKQCVEQCLLPKLNNPNRPAYSLFGGGGRRAGSYNCHQWADRQVQDCQQQCKAK